MTRLKTELNENRSEYIILAVYLYDLVIAGTTQEAIIKFKQQINAKYECKDLGELDRILNMEGTCTVEDIHTAANAEEVDLDGNSLHIFKSVTDYVECHYTGELNLEAMRGDPIASHMYERFMAEVGEVGTLLADPRTYKEAMEMPDAKTGAVECWKARLVPQGFLQTFGVDFFDTYARVAQMTSFHIIYALSVYLNLYIESMDGNVAFLKATLNDDVYIDPLAGYPPVAKGMVLKLNKALYGLKESPRG